MRYLRVLMIGIATAHLLACSDGNSARPAEVSAASAPAYKPRPVVNPGGVRGRNYTPHYIVGFGITGENGMRGGGPNIWRAEGDGPAGGGKETCCIGIPEVWKPGMKVTIRWGAEKVADGKTPAIHYMAEARIPEYARETAGMWAIFLPDNRVKVIVRDGNPNGKHNVWLRPSDDDPYVAQGVIDEEANRELLRSRYHDAEVEARERRRRANAAEAQAKDATGEDLIRLRREAAEDRRMADVAEAKAVEKEMLHRQVVEREAVERCKRDASASLADCTDRRTK